jgi:IS5 family transposase
MPTIPPSQPGLFDYQDRLDYLRTRPKGLDHLNEVVNWEVFRSELEQAVVPEPQGPGGRPRFDVVLMFKIVVLQRTYNLSDAESEFQILDRFSFQRFLGLTVADSVPDEKTLWAFKERLRKHGGLERCFAEFGRQLASRGIRSSPGKIVDATFVDVPRQQNSQDEYRDIKAGRTPDEWKKDPPARSRQKDVDARWSYKGTERHFGYKLHIKIDRQQKIIETLAVAPANVSESLVAQTLLRNGDQSLYGDSAYSRASMHQALSERGIADRTLTQARRNTPLTLQQQAWNRARRRIRVRVEHVFGFLHNSMKGLYIRTIGLERATATMTMASLVYNMHRMAQLRRA